MKFVKNNSQVFKMMMMASVTALLSSCSDIATGIKNDTDQMIIANSKAQSHIEWEGSEYNPQAVVQKYLVEYQSKKTLSEDNAKAYALEVCKGLSSISDHSLALFDNEIQAEGNKDIFTSCKDVLSKRISKYFYEDRKNLKYSVDATSDKPSNIDFKLNIDVDTNLDITNFNTRWAGLKDHEVIITFDDGPHAIYTDSILRTLKEAGNIKAMFFTLGKNVILNKVQITEEHQAGHVVANHSWNHFCMKDSDRCETYNKKHWANVPRLADSYVVAEIEQTYEAIHNAIGLVSPFVRFPFGEENETAKSYLKDRGIFRLNWSVDSNDWQGLQKVAGQNIPYTNADMIKSVINAIEAQKKGVVLFHDIHRRTAESLPQFLYELHKRQYKIILLRAPSISTISTREAIIVPNEILKVN
ncbi:MAG: polysaccharide deacetylase family protein [Bdellovibrionaceae bacterium]|nr:polysaccharide deacetylase family protein [Pseudobdellovibrionaceae bacterium]